MYSSSSKKVFQNFRSYANKGNAILNYFSLKRLTYLCFILNIVLAVILLSPLSTIFGGYFSAIFLFLLPGCSLLLVTANERTHFITYVLKAFIFSVVFTFAFSSLIGLVSSAIDRTFFILFIFLWNLSCILGALILKRRELNKSISIKRETVICIVLWALIFLAATSFALSNIHAPTPDEAYDIRQGRLFYLQPATYFSNQFEAAANKNPLVSFVLSRPIHVISVSLTMMVANVESIAAYALGAFEVSMLVFGAYGCAESISGNKKIALASAFIIALNPVIFQVGVGVLTDVSVALYILVGYVFYAKSLVWNSEGKITQISGKSLLVSGFAFLIAFLVKCPVLIFFFALLIVHLLYTLYKSRDVYKKGFNIFKVITCCIVVYLSIDAYYVLGTYYVQTLPGIAILRKVLFNSFFENIYQLFNPSAYTLASGVVPLLNATPSYVVERLYIAFLSPNYFTFALYFLFFAGLLTIFVAQKAPVKSHASFTLLLFLIPLLISLLRPTYELARGVIFLYPFIITVAACGFFNDLPKRRIAYFLVLSGGFIMFVLATEHFLLLDFHAITGGILGTTISPPTLLLLLPSLLVVIWKSTPSFFTGKIEITKLYKSKLRSLGVAVKKLHVFSWIIVAVLLFSSIYLTEYYTTVSYRHQLSPAYEKAAIWLNSHASQGEVVMSNTFFLDYFLNDATFLGVNVTTLPADFKDFQSQEENISYLVLFNPQVKPSQWEADIPYGYQYAFSSSMNPPNGMITGYRYPENNPIVQIYVHTTPH